MVSQLKFNAPNMNCEKPGAGSSGQISMRPFPKEVYGWYKSASLHTGKKTIPKQVYFLAAIVLIVPVLGYFAYGRMMPKAKPVDAVAVSASPSLPLQARISSVNAALSSAEFSSSFVPRIAGLPSTAPRYDSLTVPLQAPKIAACILGKRPGSKTVECACWSQQATRLDVSHDICKQIALGGFFDDTQPPSQGVLLQTSQSSVSLPSTAVANSPISSISASSVLVSEPAVSTVSRDAEVLAFMAKRNQFK